MVRKDKIKLKKAIRAIVALALFSEEKIFLINNSNSIACDESNVFSSPGNPEISRIS